MLDVRLYIYVFDQHCIFRSRGSDLQVERKYESRRQISFQRPYGLVA